MKQFKAFIFDIDGTILPGDKTISKNMLNYLQSLINHNYILCFATGRNFKFASEVADLLNGSFYLAINNGAVILKYPEKTIIENHSIQKNEVEIIREHLASGNHPSIVNGTIQNGESTYIFHNPPIKEPIQNFVDNTKKPYQQLNTLHESPDTHLACLYATIPTIHAYDYYHAIQSDFSENNFKLIADPICIGFHWLGLMPSNTGKENMIKYLIHHHKIQKSDILVAGDDWNDLEMIKNAGFSIAMGSAPEGVKEHANQIIGTAKEEALLLYLTKNIDSQKC